MLKGCVAVRLHDGAGYPLGYAGRRLDSGAAATRGKWVFPPRLPKSSLLYGLHRAHGKVVVVTECPWSVLRLAQIGVPGVGLLGVGISSGQQDLLQQFERVYAMMDGDPAGRIAARALAHRVGAHILDLPDGLDPDDLHDEELRGLLPFLK
jgi:DNA primase